MPMGPDIHPELQHSGPRCLRCGSRTTFYRVLPGNHNGHANRPYYACSNCGKFATFADITGIHNPLTFGENVFCSCPSYGLPRLQVAGKDKELAGRLHWVCATGNCDLFAWFGNGTVCVLDSVGIDLWKRAGLL